MIHPKNENRYNELAEKWLFGTITAEERKEFSQWYNVDQDKPFIVPVEYAQSEEAHKQRIFKEINTRIKQNGKVKPIKLSWWSAAAAVLLVAGTLLFFQLQRSLVSSSQNLVKSKLNDIKPGGDNAILTLADGKKIILKGVANGEIAEQSGIHITKTADGHLVYRIPKDQSGLNTSKPSGFNIIQTPRGGQYQVELPDGTKVWLNAASSLKYPTQFANDKRCVELVGEGYFEVAKMVKGDIIEGRRVPFIVKTATQTVEVLGTHFNINNYPDEYSTRTTLLEGSVRVSKSPTILPHTTLSKLLIPGQQAVIGASRFDIENIDVAGSIAWKNGYFFFQNEDLKSVMNKLSRWYDIDVFYQGNSDNVKIGGSISRSKSLPEVLRVIQLTGRIKFKTEERRVTVML